MGIEEAIVSQEQPELEQRLRRALAETHLDAPRPLSRLEMPFDLDRLIPAKVMASLRPAAVLAPVLRRGDSLSLLLTVRASTLRAHGGQISFPGGRRDDTDEGVVHTALREAEEEIGLPPERVDVLGYLDDYPTLSRFLVTPVVGLVEGDVRWRTDAAEVAEVFEVPLSHALDPGNFERRSLMREGLQLPFYELHWRNYRIWGATAGMLWDLAQKVSRS